MALDKDWRNDPDQSTPLSAAAMEDLEARVLAAIDGSDGGDRDVAFAFGRGLMLEADDATYDWSLYSFAQTFNGQVDEALVLGYNVTGTGAQRVGGEPNLYHVLEGHYYDGSKRWMEWNLDHKEADGDPVRFMNFSVNRADSNEAQWSINAGTHADSFIALYATETRVSGRLKIGGGVLQLKDNGNIDISGTGGAGRIAFLEQSAAPGAANNYGQLYCRDNGSGKTQLCVIFGTGAVQVLATEP